MHNIVTKACFISLEKSGHSVGAPTTVVNPLTTKIGESGNIVNSVMGMRQHSLNFFRQLIRHTLICIQRQDPIMTGMRERFIFLAAKAFPSV